MNSILILYPNLFQSYEKFCRKLSKIIQNIELSRLIYIEDSNGFIVNAAQLFNMEVLKIEDLKNNLDLITHVIIFDDGEEFTEEMNIIKAKYLPLRYIKILITRVINIHTESEFKLERSNEKYEYIGRGSGWGNPYSMLAVEDLEEGEDPREIVINNFKYDFDNNKLMTVKKEEVFTLAGKRLGCFCKPFACHGDILAEYLNSWDDGK